MTHAEIVASIDRDGYARIPGVLSPDQVALGLERVTHWFRETHEKRSPNKPYRASDDCFGCNLQNKADAFLKLFFGAEPVQAVLRHFLNDPWFKQIPPGDPNYILRNFLGRTSNERLPMHIDSLVPYSGEFCFVMQAAFILEDQDAENGCTVIVPGSHRSGQYVDQAAFDTAVPVESKAGDLVIWDSRIWHGASENRSGRSRWSLIATCTRWWLKQGFDIPYNLPQEIYERLTPPEKAVLGFCSLPYANEMEGIDMKRGYDSLAPRVSDYRRKSG